MSSIYINLPVTNLTASIQFYKALGFTQNMDFSNDQAAAMTYDTNLTVMLLTHNFMTQFLPEGKSIADSHKTCQVLNALSCDSREAVDTFFHKAIAAGGKATIPSYDHGLMYGHDFEDIDGHIWEVFWMQQSI